MLKIRVLFPAWKTHIMLFYTSVASWLAAYIHECGPLPAVVAYTSTTTITTGKKSHKFSGVPLLFLLPTAQLLLLLLLLLPVRSFLLVRSFLWSSILWSLPLCSYSELYLVYLRTFVRTWTWACLLFCSLCWREEGDSAYQSMSGTKLEFVGPLAKLVSCCLACKLYVVVPLLREIERASERTPGSAST